jgi:hypothetical protein
VFEKEKEKEPWWKRTVLVVVRRLRYLFARWSPWKRGRPT